MKRRIPILALTVLPTLMLMGCQQQTYVFYKNQGRPIFKCPTEIRPPLALQYLMREEALNADPCNPPVRDVCHPSLRYVYSLRPPKVGFCPPPVVETPVSEVQIPLKPNDCLPCREYRYSPFATHATPCADS